MRKRIVTLAMLGLVFTVALSLVVPTPAHGLPAAQSALPSGFHMETVTDNLDLPTTFSFVPDGRIFIAEKAGRVKVWKPGQGYLNTRPLIDIRDEVDSFVDRGLIGMAIDPDFMHNGYLYLLYAWDAPGQAHNVDEPRRSRLVRYTVEGDVVRPNSSLVLLGDHMNDKQNHSVGTLAFAPDGALFVSLGDGSLSAMPDQLSLRAQRLDNVQGKLLRIDPRTGEGLKGNPFFDPANPMSARSRIWAYGFRNPFRFAVSPLTSLPYVADVGWNSFESLMIATSGADFGWPCLEGETLVKEFASAQECAGLTYAKTQKKEMIYPHSGNNAAVVAGDFITGPNFPAHQAGGFLFGDYSQQFIKRAQLGPDGHVTSVEAFATGAGELVAMKFGPDGALYTLSIYSGGLRRIVQDGAPLGSLTTTTALPAKAAQALSARIVAPFDGDTVLGGTRVKLVGEATGASSASWHITRHTGRQATVITDTLGSTSAFTMPGDLGDDGYVEAIFSATASSGTTRAARVKVFTPNSDGYIRAWWLMGGYPYRALADNMLPGGEANYIPKPDDPLAWPIRSATRNVNFLRYITPVYKTMAYAFVWIDSPQERKGLLGMNSDDGIAAWLNGKEIWRHKISRYMPDDTRDIDLPAIQLKKGLNALLIKVDQNDGDWQFKARILNADGSIMRDVTARLGP